MEDWTDKAISPAPKVDTDFHNTEVKSIILGLIHDNIHYFFTLCSKFPIKKPMIYQ